MERLWKLFEEGVVVQASLSLGLGGAVIYLVVTGQPVPDLLAALFGTVMGFWFGTKSQQYVHRQMVSRSK